MDEEALAASVIGSLFEWIDADDNGSLDRDEIVAALTTLGIRPSDEQIASAMGDAGHHGVTPAGFAGFLGNLEAQDSTVGFRLMFHAFDRDGDGNITPEEFGALLEFFYPDAESDDELPRFADLDTDGDGALSWQEVQVALS